MKKLFVILLFFAALTGQAQGHKQVQWEFSSRVVEGKTELILTAKVETGWHIYSQYMEGDGPIPTSFEYKLPSGMKVDGKTIEPTPIKHYDENFGMDVYFFNEKAEFIQRLNGETKKNEVVTGKVTFMICNDEMCLPPTDVPFEIKL